MEYGILNLRYTQYVAFCVPYLNIFRLASDPKQSRRMAITKGPEETKAAQKTIPEKMK